jgi:hypothetical protein
MCSSYTIGEVPPGKEHRFDIKAQNGSEIHVLTNIKTNSL